MRMMFSGDGTTSSNRAAMVLGRAALGRHPEEGERSEGPGTMTN